MVNGNVAVLPKERRPRARKSPQSTEPAVDEVRDEDWAMGVIVEVDADIYPGDPTEHRSRRCHKGDARPEASDAYELGMLVQPEGASVCHEANAMERHAVPVLRVGENAPTNSANGTEWQRIMAELTRKRDFAAFLSRSSRAFFISCSYVFS